MEKDYFLTDEKFKSFLNRLHENVELLAEQIRSARATSKKKGKDANALQRTKPLRDLIELRNLQLDKIKVHLLGRDETGAVTEPANEYDGNNPVVEFERYFHRLMTHWTLTDLTLKCDDCDFESKVTSKSCQPKR